MEKKLKSVIYRGIEIEFIKRKDNYTGVSWIATYINGKTLDDNTTKFGKKGALFLAKGYIDRYLEDRYLLG